jgi:hypothetical protein
MDKEKRRGILKKALALYGTDHQVNMVKEEISELISELGKCIVNLSSLLAGINHLDRGKITEDELCGEVVDVEITIEYLKMVLSEDKINSIREQKLERLERVLDESQS